MNKQPITTLWLGGTLIWTVRGHLERETAIAVAMDQSLARGDYDVTQSLTKHTHEITAVLCLNGEPCRPVIIGGTNETLI